MELTGKAKELFEKWYLSDAVPNSYPHIVNFYGLDDSLQWGVLQDFADSLGIHVSTYMGVDESIGYEFEITIIEKHSTSNYPFERKVKETNGVGGYQTREQARYSAVDKFDDILNKR